LTVVKALFAEMRAAGVDLYDQPAVDRFFAARSVAQQGAPRANPRAASAPDTATPETASLAEPLAPGPPESARM
jgi:hypothetical protein